MNCLKIAEGEEFTLRTGEKMRIEKIEDGLCIVRCVKTGKSYMNGAEALRRVELYEGACERDGV